MTPNYSVSLCDGGGGGGFVFLFAAYGSVYLTDTHRMQSCGAHLWSCSISLCFVSAGPPGHYDRLYGLNSLENEFNPTKLVGWAAVNIPGMLSCLKLIVFHFTTGNQNRGLRRRCVQHADLQMKTRFSINIVASCALLFVSSHLALLQYCKSEEKKKGQHGDIISIIWWFKTDCCSGVHCDLNVQSNIKKIKQNKP